MSKLLKICMTYFGGSIGKAKNMVLKKELYDTVDTLLSMIEKSNKLDFYLAGKPIYLKDEIQEILEYFIVSLYNLKEKNQSYLNGIDIVQNTINKLNSNCNFDMCIDSMLFGLWEEINENYCRS